MDWDSGEPMRVTGVDVSGFVFLNIFKKNLTKWTTFQWFLIVVHKIHNLGIFPFSGEYQCSIMFCSLTAYFWCVNPHFSWTKPQFWFVFHDQTAKHHDIIMLNPYPSCVNHTKSIELSIFHAETLHSKNPQGDNFPRRPLGLAGLAPQRPGIWWAPWTRHQRRPPCAWSRDTPGGKLLRFFLGNPSTRLGQS